jgi:hypothetical protein
MADLNEERMALISVLTEHSPQGHIGRTAVMKLLYFLQTLRDVPLGYRFSLYSYGPFDSDVLADLSNAESLGVVNSEVIQFPGGYGYEIRPGRNAEWLRARSAKFLRQYESEVDWVIDKFGMLNSGQLELVSTIIYVYREATLENGEPSLGEIAETVKEIKPHFSIDQIMEFAVQLRDDGLLEAAA